jgi:hypothetical protein
MLAAAMATMLQDVARSLGHQGIALRVETDLLETVYVSVEDDAVFVHDDGATFLYIREAEAPGGDSTYITWSLEAAREAIDGLAVELVGEETPDEASFRLQIQLTPSDEVGPAVERLSSAIDNVFENHTRDDLRRTW